MNEQAGEVETVVLKLYTCKKNHPIHVFRVCMLHFNNPRQKMNWRENKNWVWDMGKGLPTHTDTRKSHRASLGCDRDPKGDTGGALVARFRDGIAAGP